MTVAKNSQLRWIKLMVAIGLLSIFQIPAQSLPQMQSSPNQAQPGVPNKASSEISLDVNMGGSNAQTSASIGGNQQGQQHSQGQGSSGGLGSIFSHGSTTNKPQEGIFNKAGDSQKKGSGQQEGNQNKGFIEKVQNVMNKGNEGLQKIEDKALNMGQKFEDKASNMSQKFEDKASNMGQKFEDKASNMTQKMQKVGEEAKNNITSSQQGQQSQQSPQGQQGKQEDKNKENKLPSWIPFFGKSNNSSEKGNNPLEQIIETTQEVLTKPLKPVEKLFDGAFKTSDESRKDQDKTVMKGDAKGKLDQLHKAENMKKENRSLAGIILDKYVDFVEKPFEVMLKPVDKLLGFDKDGKKDPLIKTFDQIYGLSKKPVDTLTKPVEKILRKMGGGQSDPSDPLKYEVSIRWKGGEKNDPKLVSRLADGTLDIADRVLTKPLEIVMRPFDGILGFENHTNPIVQATHSLKNASRLGVELFTRPFDRMIEEIAEIGDYTSDKQRNEALERRKKEASRIVHVMDKIHDLVKAPFEIVMRPVIEGVGIVKKGDKLPMIMAWDIIHHVFRTPVQVITKPIEDAIFHEKESQNSSGDKSKPKDMVQNAINILDEKNKRKNIVTDSIKKVEKLYFHPIELMTSPIRRLILGKQNKTEGQGSKDKNKDKIVMTVIRLNNVMLKPLEVVTQPISDIFTGEKNQDEGKRSGNEQNNKQDDNKVGNKMQQSLGMSSTQKPQGASNQGGQSQGGQSQGGQSQGGQSQQKSGQEQQPNQVMQNPMQNQQSNQKG